jgi:hypothetical protein
MAELLRDYWPAFSTAEITATLLFRDKHRPQRETGNDSIVRCILHKAITGKRVTQAHRYFIEPHISLFISHFRDIISTFTIQMIFFALPPMISSHAISG